MENAPHCMTQVLKDITSILYYSTIFFEITALRDACESVTAFAYYQPVIVNMSCKVFHLCVCWHLLNEAKYSIKNICFHIVSFCV